jgi:dipeptidyl aminopeptidase/acylaminoacyl peptidase
MHLLRFLAPHLQPVYRQESSVKRDEIGMQRFKTTIFAAIVFAACCTHVASAAETEVSYEVDGQTVRGALETPPGDPAPVVLLIHGIGGPRDELPIAGTDEGVFSRSARLLAEAGYASLRIDHRGYGQSDGDPLDVSITQLISDAETAIDWLSESDVVDKERIAVLGWSQGGMVAAHAIAGRPAVKTLILWAPVVNVVTHAYYGYGVKAINQALEDDSRESTYIRDSASYSTPGAVALYKGSMLVIGGSQDEVLYPQPAMSAILLRYHDGVESLLMFDMDHAFGAKEGPQIIDEKMIPSTLDWLNKYL